MPKFPSLNSEAELAKFVDTHDSAPYCNEMRLVDPSLLLVVRRRSTATRVPLSRAMAERLNSVAGRRGVSASELAKAWLSQRLKEESVAG